MMKNRVMLKLVLGAFVFFSFAGLLFGPRSVLARGGEGIGITAEPDSVAGTAPDTTAGGWGDPDFIRFVAWNDRIAKDINFLVSESFTGGLALSDNEKNAFLRAVDDSINNEYGFQVHDFGLTFNYFACPDTAYGDYLGDYNVLFKLGPQNPSDPNYYGVSERDHLDYFFALYGVDADNYGTKTYGRYTSAFYDADEDPPYAQEDPTIDTKYHLNSCEGYDGVTGKASADSLHWYFSGKHANLMFVHEYQHLCYQSQTNPNGWLAGGWPNEFFSTAAEYLGGTLKGGFPWNLFYDVRCDESVVAGGASRFQTWRLFATYLFHQLGETGSSYSDDLVYKWLRRSDVSPTTYRGLYHLAKELENSPWSSKLTGADGAAKLRSLFQDWAIAKALNDSTRYAPGDSITLAFKRGFSPYYDIGLFWDVDATCCAANSKALPHEHVVNQSSIDNFAWVTSYTSHADSVWGTCSDCKGSQLTVAQKADPIDVPTWGSDYVLFKASSLESGGPYDLKIKIRGDAGNAPPANNRIQAAVLTYSSADSVFRTSENLLEVREVSISPDSAKANVTVCGFGGDVKAAVLIVGLAYNNLNSGLDSYSLWNYKYGYTVEKHWKSGAVPWSVTWFDSIHVNGDVTVGENKTVTVEPGTRVEFFPGDTQSGGQSSTLSELILGGHAIGAGGRLVAEGAVSDSILFTSGAGSPGPFDWYGVRMVQGSSPFEPKYCRFEHAMYPIMCLGDTLFVDSCLIRSYGFVGVYAGGADIVRVEDTSMDMSEDFMAIWLADVASGIVTRNNLWSPSPVGAAGVLITNGSSVTVSQNTFFGMDNGIEVVGSDLTSFGNTISGVGIDGIKAFDAIVSIECDSIALGDEGVRGIELLGTASGAVSHNKITGPGNRLTYGIELKDSADPEVQYNWIQGVKYGIKMSAASSADISHNWIKGTTGNGIQCAGDAVPVLRYNTVDSLQGTAVTALDYAIPDLGASPDSGSNRIYQASSYYVANLTEYTVAAELNWWGSSSPSFRKFYGHVDYSPLCTSDPGTSYALPLALLPAAGPVVPYVTQNYPNPFNPRTTIEYGVSEPGTRVKVVVYDISGRVVRVLVDETRAAGQHIVVWDGRNERGGVVVSGVYVCDVSVGSLRQQKKLVVLR